MNHQPDAGRKDWSHVDSHWIGAISSFQNGQMHDAISSCQKVLELEPEHFDAVQLVGMAAKHLGQHAHAENFFRTALSMRPNSIETLNELGVVLMSQGRLEPALEYFRRTLELVPDSPEVNFNVANALHAMDRVAEALPYCQASIALKRDFAQAHVLLGTLHYRMDNLHRALESLNSACQLAPNDVNVLSFLAKVKIDQGRSEAALPYLNRILAQSPEHELANALIRLALNNLQNLDLPRDTLFNAGLIHLAEARVRDELSRDNSVDNHNFLLKCYLSGHQHTAREYFLESRAWYESSAHEELLPLPGEFQNDRNPDRRLRVGIIGDYFASVISRYTLYPFFKLYDRSQLELYCYNFGSGEEEIRPLVDQYRDIRQFSGEDVFSLIRQDSIDIMLDINGRIRTPNYFETLLRQPAPIQVNWYNLPCTVGAKAYNYAITDEYCVRDGEESVFVEKVFKMPTGTICAWDLGEPPVVPPPPCKKNGFVTFGCFGDFFKVGEVVLATWADLLGQVPDSRLYLKSNNLRLMSECERVSEFFNRRGIGPDRLVLEGMSPYNQMKKCYELVDIALDTFPYSSGSTTINALWQGVPVVAIEGEDWRGRSTAAVLAGCGLNELIAQDVEGYLRLARALAADSTRLTDLRASLGKRAAASPQWDVETFTRNFEARLRMIWRDWLSSQ